MPKHDTQSRNQWKKLLHARHCFTQCHSLFSHFLLCWRCNSNVFLSGVWLVCAVISMHLCLAQTEWPRSVEERKIQHVRFKSGAAAVRVTHLWSVPRARWAFVWLPQVNLGTLVTECLLHVSYSFSLFFGPVEVHYSLWILLWQAMCSTSWTKTRSASRH